MEAPGSDVSRLDVTLAAVPQAEPVEDSCWHCLARLATVQTCDDTSGPSPLVVLCRYSCSNVQ